jgi:hypothetical protein
MPLSAARGAWRIGAPVSLLSQGTYIERTLLAAAGIEAPLVEPHGTVAATALDLALAATRGPVVLAGQDLCAIDIGTHARPNAFDALLWAGDGRLSPRYGLAYARARAGEASSRVVDGVRIRLSRSLDTYAGWMSHRCSAAGRRVHRLDPSPVDLPGASPLDGDGLAALVFASASAGSGPSFAPDPRWPGRGGRQRAAREVLSHWGELLLRGASRARTGSWAETLAEAPELADLAWHASARGLIDAKRRQRLGDPEGARTAAVALLEEAGAFVRSLDARLAAGESPP